ncbi:MAG: hypothetical protein H8K06_13185 [Nitrospira sp.]|nr:hypothetical protein [Nitrospira sp.]
MLVGLVVVFMGMAIWRQATAVPPQEVPLKFKSGLSVASRTKPGDEDAFEFALPRASHDESPARLRKNIFASLDAPLLREPKARQKTPRSTSNLHGPVVSSLQPTSTASSGELASPVEPAGPPSPSAEELAAQAEREQQALKVKQAREQMAQFRYLGYLNQNGEQKGFVGKGHEIYIVRQGDTLDGRFLVATIDGSAVILRDAVQHLETTLQLKSDSSSDPS